MTTSSIFVFASDLADEGIETVLDRVAAAGIGGVTLAATYHEGRDVFPHGRSRRVAFHEEGALFAPVTGWERLSLPTSLLAGQHPALVVAAAARSLDLRAWSVFLHNGVLARAHPDCAPENVFGDRYTTELCPSHPDARAFARILSAGLAGAGFATICAESLHFHGFAHGSGHERSFVRLGARAQFLLGLCLCSHCCAAAPAVDTDALRSELRAELELALTSLEPASEQELERPEGELDAFLRAREATVASLVAECAEAARAQGATFEVIDPSGATKGYADGLPTGDPAPSIAWQAGLDLAAVAAACDGIEALGYALDPARIGADLDAYGKQAVSLALRPMWPDCDGPQNLREKIELAEWAFELGRVDFYHYGLMQLEALDWIRAALSSSA
ncbi:MAG: hypothetical protein QOH73_1422 [Gaiellaceae bacterium]|nr:hypothetical protein [Gaiellaceae bacterium]